MKLLYGYKITLVSYYILIFLYYYYLILLFYQDITTLLSYIIIIIHCGDQWVSLVWLGGDMFDEFVYVLCFV